jgi:hypothetical protein
MFKTWLKYFPPCLFSIICMKNVLFLSHLQTDLDIIVIFWKNWVSPTPITTHKNNIPFGYLKKLNIYFETKCSVILPFLNIDLHACDHSPTLVCTKLMFDYHVMFNGGQFYSTQIYRKHVNLFYHNSIMKFIYWIYLFYFSNLWVAIIQKRI